MTNSVDSGTKVNQKISELNSKRGENSGWAWAVGIGTVATGVVCLFSNPNGVDGMLSNFDSTSCFIGVALAGGLVTIGTVVRDFYLESVEGHLNEVKNDQDKTNG